MIQFNQISSILLIIFIILETIKADSKTFPSLFDENQLDNLRLHIITEAVTRDNGYRTTEEYIDMNIGKQTYIVTDKSGQSVTHVNAAEEMIYRYKPYTCIATQPGSIDKSELSADLWTTIAKINSNDNKSKDMHVYGITALWLKSMNLPKTYSFSSIVYSASKDIYRSAHKWTWEDKESNEMISFFFIESTAAYGTKLSLEMVQVEEKDTKKLILTLNILSMDNIIPDPVYDNLLQIPVGYGCEGLKNVELFNGEEEEASFNNSYIGSLLRESHWLEIEATATKYQENAAEGQRRLIDTISVDLVKTVYSDLMGSHGLQLVRLRDSHKDIKTVLNYEYNVQYEIDLRRGSCKMSNIYEKIERGENVAIKFNNNLEFDIDLDMMDLILISMSGYNLIKRTSKGSFKDYIYFEKTSDKLFTGKISRIVRKYSSSSSRKELDIKLESVTIWVLDSNATQILESYHLNIIEATKLESQLEMAKMFDVSEECYLNNNDMKEGRDFAWFELTYPISTHYGDVLASKASVVKEQLYHMIVDGSFGLNRVPRMEIMFLETGFILRALLLDIPALHLIYDMKDKTTFAPDKSSGDLEELASDLEHCEEFCKFYKCKTMSFCESNHFCQLSVAIPSELGTNNEVRKFVPNQSCQTYTLPRNELTMYEILHELSLHSQISKLQHQEYCDVVLPKIPDELVLPQSETNIDEETHKKLLDDYVKTLYKFMNEDGGQRLPLQTYLLNIDGVIAVLVPNKFEIEQDPLNDFDLTDKDASLNDVESSIVPAFHEGLSMHHYKIGVINNEASKKKARLFNGLNYDQCSLACIDSRCSSFSYCTHRQECIISDIYDVGQSISSSYVEQDLDCFIAQRDFLSKFHKFPGVARPSVYKKSSSNSFNPSECAHSCMIETNFNCLAFDYCKPATSGDLSSEKGNQELATCFYLETYTSVEDIVSKKIALEAANSKRPLTPTQAIGCDHYSRSYLADFSRIQYRKIDDNELAKLRTSTFQGKSVDQCADICVNDLTDCTAFQFCFDPSASGAMQTCVLIESVPAGDKADYQVVLNETNGLDEDVVSAGKFIKTDPDCHLFSLRIDSTEAHLRDLALNSMSVDDTRKRGARNKRSSGGLSIFGGILLYFCLTILSAAIGCGIMLAKDRNQYVRQKMERLRVLLGW